MANLTRDDVLSRLREIWEIIDLKGDELSPSVSERIGYNLSVARLFVDLQGAKDFNEVHEIGFGTGETDDEEDVEE